MRLSKDYQYQVLCEDVQMRTFILSVLTHQGINTGKPIKCKEEAKLCSMFCQDIAKVDCSNVSSLQMAKNEYIRVCQLQQKK